ncbi:MAG: Bax inhibitor-1/YccA family protein [Ancrocorticia sp.]|nr:Bax inhibitor-1/YccA family protein [Ancrocorticia sp.]
MSNNPVLNRNPYFNAQAATPNTAYAGEQFAQQQQAYAQFQAQQQRAQQSAYAQGPFVQQPVAVMTYDDAMVRTFELLAVAIVAGIATAVFVPLQSIGTVAIVASLAAFAFGMWASFQRMVKPVLAFLYSGLQGVALGALTGALDILYPGIAFQAVLGTVIVVAVAVGLHMSGKVRTTPKGRRIMLTVMIAAIIFSFVNLILIWTGVASGMWGLASGNFGIVLGFLMIAVAGYMLISDLETIQIAVAKGAPKEFAWTCALGIVMTVLWIYIEVLRLLSIFANRS